MQPVILFDAAAATDPGWRYTENQDAVMLGSEVRQGMEELSLGSRPELFVGAADGLAYAPCASRASRMVLEELAQLADGSRLTGRFAKLIQERMVSVAVGTRCEGMASTLAAVQFTQDEVRVLSIGDTRVYLWRDGVLRQVTEDHTIANRMVREGDLTSEEAARAGSLYSDLDSALVASCFEDMFQVDLTVLAPYVGDVWLCLSDGIHGAVPDRRIAALISRCSTAGPDVIARGLVEMAKENKQLDDNVSAVVVGVRRAVPGRT